MPTPTHRDVTFKELCNLFKDHKHRIETPLLHDKAHLVIELNKTSSSTLSLLNTDCLAYVNAFLLEKATIEGPHPGYMEGPNTRSIPLIIANTHIKPTSSVWIDFRAYVSQFPGWGTGKWRSSMNWDHHYYLLFKPQLLI